MDIIKTDFEGVFLLKPKVFQDSRGYFLESFKEKTFSDLGIDAHFIQDNEAVSTFGVVRGLHYQIPPYAQAKLVRVVSGKVLDVIVDIRENSATYGKCFSVILDDQQKLQLFVPKGFAHGYVCLSEKAVFAYKVDAYYHAASEGGVRWNDVQLGIDWGITTAEALVSLKDQVLPLFGQHLKYAEE